MAPPEELESKLLEEIDRTLLILGEVSKRLIYEHIERTHGVIRLEVPRRLDALNEAFLSLMGPSAKSVIEETIAEKFYRSLGLEFKRREGWTLKKYVEDAKRTMGERVDEG